MRNTSCTSGIPRSFHVSEGLSALRGQGPHRRWTDAQDARRLLGRISEEVREQESGPLAWSDLEEEPAHVHPHLRVEELVTSLRDREDLPDGHRRPAPAPPNPFGAPGKGGAGGGGVPVALPPSPPHFEEAALHPPRAVR